jgi:hypothetical protein
MCRKPMAERTSNAGSNGRSRREPAGASRDCEGFVTQRAPVRRRADRAPGTFGFASLLAACLVAVRLNPHD